MTKEQAIERLEEIRSTHTPNECLDVAMFPVYEKINGITVKRMYSVFELKVIAGEIKSDSCIDGMTKLQKIIERLEKTKDSHWCVEDLLAQLKEASEEEFVYFNEKKIEEIKKKFFSEEPKSGGVHCILEDDKPSIDLTPYLCSLRPQSITRIIKAYFKLDRDTVLDMLKLEKVYIQNDACHVPRQQLIDLLQIDSYGLTELSLTKIDEE